MGSDSSVDQYTDQPTNCCPSWSFVLYRGGYAPCAWNGRFLTLRFWTGVVLPFWQIQWVWMPFYVLYFTLDMTTFRVAFWRLPTGKFFTPWFRTALTWLPPVVTRLYSIHPVFWCLGDTVFFVCSSVCFTSNERHDQVRNELEVNNLFDNHSEAALVLKYFATGASSLSPMMSIWSKCNITLSTTLYMTDLTTLCTIWSVPPGTSSSAFLYIVAILITTSSFKVDFTSCTMRSSFSSPRFSVCRLFCSTRASSISGAATSADHNWLLSFNDTSHAGIGMSLF